MPTLHHRPSGGFPTRAGRLMVAGVALLLAACGSPDGATHPDLAGRRPGGALDLQPPYITHVYTHGHPDDWQLFMGDRAVASHASAASVVFIYSTAGDAGSGSSYWQLRETAALNSTNGLGGSGAWSCAPMTVAGHAIRRCGRGKVAHWFLRLPDGGTAGGGFGYGSLQRLRDQGTAISALDATATYTSWADFVGTLRGIIDLETAGQSAPNVVVSAPETDRATNPGDHSDHWATGDAILAASAVRTWDLAWFIDYHTQNLPENLTPTAYQQKDRTWFLYDSTMATRYFTEYNDYQRFVRRTYFRTSRSSPTNPPPAAPTSLAGSTPSATEVVLTWADNATSEEGYQVEQAPDVGGQPGTFTQVAVTGANVATASIGSLQPVTTYWFRVRAFNAAGISSWTPAVSVTTPQVPAPAAPSDVTLAAPFTGQINVSWLDNSTNETGFRVERAPDVSGAPGTFATVATLGANTTTHADNGTNGATRYWYRVAAYNQGGTGTSSAASVLTPASAFPLHVYAHGHADDWQLFMGDRAVASYGAAGATVFIYTTAGDAGSGASYWKLREDAALNSTDGLGGTGAWTCGTSTVNGHAIRRCTRGKAVHWFMRLPDGGMAGGGFGRGSLQRLRDLGVALSALDGTATYASWTDFVTTLRGIVTYETQRLGAQFVATHGPDYDRTVNPGDHSDHWATGEALRTAATGQGWGTTWFVDYHTQNLPENLTPTAYQQKDRTWFLYDSTMARRYFSEYNDYQRFVRRTYSRTTTTP